jgi:hypothetical protein
MPLDKIVIIVLALLFFGGVLLLAWKNRQGKGGADQSSSGSADPQTEEGVSPFQPREKDRRKPKI